MPVVSNRRCAAKRNFSGCFSYCLTALRSPWKNQWGAGFFSPELLLPLRGGEGGEGQEPETKEATSLFSKCICFYIFEEQT